MPAKAREKPDKQLPINQLKARTSGNHSPKLGPHSTQGPPTGRRRASRPSSQSYERLSSETPQDRMLASSCSTHTLPASQGSGERFRMWVSASQGRWCLDTFQQTRCAEHKGDRKAASLAAALPSAPGNLDQQSAGQLRAQPVCTLKAGGTLGNRGPGHS